MRVNETFQNRPITMNQKNNLLEIEEYAATGVAMEVPLLATYAFLTFPFLL